MFKGFYNLTSGVLTHQRNLNVIANNMTNISTPGYKQDRYTATTFDEVMYSRVGNKDGRGEDIGKQSYIRATSDVITDFTQGAPEYTGYPLDFAITGEGFFGVETLDGEIGYTRAGSFSLDDEGYLCLPGMGYILDPNGQRIRLTTDKIHGDPDGTLLLEDGSAVGRIGLFTFPKDPEPAVPQEPGEPEQTKQVFNLERNRMGLFVGDNAQVMNEGKILNGYVERSNTDPVKQMTEMITYQRSLQSAAQVMKMYDSLMSKATTDVGRL